MNKSSKQPRKLPPPLPEWIVKAIWNATAHTFIVSAKDEVDAWNRGWKKVARTEGGDSCLQVKVLGQRTKL